MLLTEFNVKNRTYRDPFPGVGSELLEWYAIDFKGWLTVPASGDYEFQLKSDDGSRLSIDGDVAIDHDGIHSAIFSKKNKVRLSAGLHRIRLEYFQGPRHHIALQLFWMPPDQKKWQIVPSSALSGDGYADRHCY